MHLGILILNYQSWQPTVQLVSALQEQTLASESHIVIVDNASPNQSYKELKALESRYERITVLSTERNLGYAQGNNVGLKYMSQELHADYVAILNNDVVLPKDCLEKLCQKYPSLPRPAIIAPVMLDTEGHLCPPYRLNRFVDDLRLLFFLGRLFPDSNKLELKDNTGFGAMRVDMIPGSFMFTSLSTFEALGYFYPYTFLYAEERFVAHAVREAGLNNYLIMDQSFIHAHQSPTISTFYDQAGEYGLLYHSWLEYTRVCRSHGKWKARLLKPLIKYSLWEWKLASWCKRVLANERLD